MSANGYLSQYKPGLMHSNYIGPDQCSITKLNWHKQKNFKRLFYAIKINHYY